MKKISTAAVKQSRNISQQKLTIGLDLGDRNSWCCVVDEAGLGEGAFCRLYTPLLEHFVGSVR
jgi:Ethanolamine utilization protein EutJ (predicted chaperonin)